MFWYFQQKKTRSFYLVNGKNATLYFQTEYIFWMWGPRNKNNRQCPVVNFTAKLSECVNSSGNIYAFYIYSQKYPFFWFDSVSLRLLRLPAWMLLFFLGVWINLQVMFVLRANKTLPEYVFFRLISHRKCARYNMQKCLQNCPE